MKKYSTIRRQLIAAVLLMILSFSITPKKLLHDAIAKHKDKIAVSGDNSLQISNPGFACKCDSLVAESPFTEQHNYFEFSPLLVISEQRSIVPYHFHSSDYYFFELRGPPIV